MFARRLLRDVIYQNLFTYSEQLDNVIWQKDGYTVVANNTIAPNGTLTADKLIDSGEATFFSQIVFISANTLNTHSFYLKRINHDWVRIAIGVGTNQARMFANLSDGTIGNVNANGSATNVSVTSFDAGNGWYRFSVSGIIPTATNVSAFISSAISNGDTTRVVGGERYQWGGQFNAGSTPNPYQQTVDFGLR
jgi:hypothetical protein